jgi:hypothetical protein
LLLLLLLLRPSGTSAFVLSMSHYVFFDCDDCCYQVSYPTGRNWNSLLYLRIRAQRVPTRRARRHVSGLSAP